MQRQSTAGGLGANGRSEVSAFEVLQAYALAWAGTAILGALTFVVWGPKMWWLTIAAGVSLAVACRRLRNRAEAWEGISPAFVAFLFYLTASVILLGGLMYEWLEDPLPGLPTGDSTFFFVSPLVELAGAMIGSFIGGSKSQASNAYEEEERLSTAR